MPTPTEPLDLLGAVNIVLKNDGEAPVASLDESGFSEAATAQDTIHEISRTVQTDGWGFNTDWNRKFIPDVSNEIVLPSNLLVLEPSGYSCGLAVVERGRKLYDLEANGYTFTSPVYLNVVQCLDFDELPAPARYYIAVRAARVYQARGTGSGTQNSFTEEDEGRAEAAMRKADRRMFPRGFFRNPYNAAALLRRPL
jgi:hypothetical protein